MKLRLVVLAVVAVVLVLAGARSLASSRTFQLFGDLVHRVETSDRVVALTFDDGPTATGVDSILTILADEDVLATFFFTGSELAANPGLAERVVAAGHELGNHSYSHKRFLLRSPGFIRREVETTDSLIRAAGHRGPIHFRPPYGKKLVGLPLYLSRTGRTSIMWDVEPESDPAIGGDAGRIVEHVAREVRPGSIILLHVMYPSRRESLTSVRGIVRRLRADGYTFVRVSELLDRGRS